MLLFLPVYCLLNGPKSLLNGALFRMGSLAHLKNSIVVDWPIAVRVELACAQANIRVRNNLLHGFINPDTAVMPGTALDLSSYPNSTWAGCSPGFANATVKMVAPYAANPDYTLQTGSPALSGADFTGLNGVTVTTYRGAFPASTVAGANWTTGWARWNF